jgi:hypothetical protein
MSRKYAAPSFLEDPKVRESYERWLGRKASAHVKRDKARGNESANGASYKAAIHKAVLDSEGKDFYTGEALDWSLLSKYDNIESKLHGRAYKKKFALLPSVDHVGDGRGAANFKICAWRTNDCKNDLSHDELIQFCRKVLKHANENA